jgi:hypothetical protein
MLPPAAGQLVAACPVGSVWGGGVSEPPAGLFFEQRDAQQFSVCRSRPKLRMKSPANNASRSWRMNREPAAL